MDAGELIGFLGCLGLFFLRISSPPACEVSAEMIVDCNWKMQQEGGSKGSEVEPAGGTKNGGNGGCHQGGPSVRALLAPSVLHQHPALPRECQEN